MNVFAYVMFGNDRHIDPVIEVFTSRILAIDRAKEFMRNHMAHPESIVENRVDEYEIYLTYLEEGDHAYVVKRQIQ